MTPLEIQIQFSKSPSVSFKHALELAKKAPSFTEDPATCTFTATFNAVSVALFNELSGIVQNWKGTNFIINSRAITPKWKITWLRQAFACHLTKQEFEHREFYCAVNDAGDDTLFPCQFLTLALWDFDNKQYVETISGQQAWKVDRILFEIERQLKERMAYYCPSLDLQAIERIVKTLPSPTQASDSGVDVRATPFGLAVKWPPWIIEAARLANQDETDRKVERLLEDIPSIDDFE